MKDVLTTDAPDGEATVSTTSRVIFDKTLDSDPVRAVGALEAHRQVNRDLHHLRLEAKKVCLKTMTGCPGPTAACLSNGDSSGIIGIRACNPACSLSIAKQMQGTPVNIADVENTARTTMLTLVDTRPTPEEREASLDEWKKRMPEILEAEAQEMLARLPDSEVL